MGITVLLGFCDLLFLILLSLVFDPLLELPDGFAFYRELNVCIGRVNSRAGGMAHERHANFLHDAGLHQARIEGVAKIMEANVTDPSVSEDCFPGRFYDPDRSVPVLNDKAFGLALA
jgi:hypothetical protein